jgi:hypothetical protein
LTLQSQENYQIDSTSKWIQQEEWVEVNMFYEKFNVSLKIQGDTVLNDTMYRKILLNGQRYYDYHGYGPGTEYYHNKYFGAVRQNSGDVFYCMPGSTNSLKLYDYNYSVGDTISSRIGVNLIIQNIDTLEDGRKKFITNDPELFILEEIGSNLGFINMHMNYNPGVMSSGILGCYYQSDTIEFVNDENVCNYIFTHVLESAKTSSIFPNPVSNYLYINIDEPITSIEVLNLLGIQQNIYIVEPDEVNVSTLKEGLYLLRINHKKGIVFIKQ